MICDDGWVRCPQCGEKTRLKVTLETVIEKLPLFCPKCKKVTKVNVKHNKVTQSH